MNPHRLAWGFVTQIPLAQIIAVTTLVGMLLSRRWRFPPLTTETIILAVFCLWMQLTTLLALSQQDAWDQWEKVLKIQFMVLVTMMVIQTYNQLRALVWVVAGSICFYGVKGGIWTALRGGEERVYGPPGSFIEGNNELGLAMIMILPIVRYLQLTTPFKWLRGLLLGVIVVCMVSVVGTYSRGAFLGIVAMLAVMFWRSKRRLGLVVLIAIVSPIALSIMPQKWHERMGSIRTYEQDSSAMGRLHSWTFALRLASDRPAVGGGFEAFKPEVFGRYGFEPNSAADAHSIYFEVLGEHGFVGLLLFLTLGLAAWSTCSWTIRHSRDDPRLADLEQLARMIQVSLAGYAVSGAFLGLAYFDLYYNLIAFGVIAKLLVASQAETSQIAVATNTPPQLASPRLERLF